MAVKYLKYQVNTLIIKCDSYHLFGEHTKMTHLDFIDLMLHRRLKGTIAEILL